MILHCLLHFCVKNQREYYFRTTIVFVKKSCNACFFSVKSIAKSGTANKYLEIVFKQFLNTIEKTFAEKPSALYMRILVTRKPIVPFAGEISIIE